MNEGLTNVFKQQEKNITLLIVCGTLVAVVHPSVAAAVMSGVCTAVGASFVARNWAGKAQKPDA